MIVNHNEPECREARRKLGRHKYNGAYYYSQEICKNIIPNVQTDRNWLTMVAGEKGYDHSICFVHNNVTFEDTYAYTKKFKDVIYVVGLPDMVERAEKFGKTIYLPLSVDIEYVKQYKTEKTKDTAIIGRDSVKWFDLYDIPEGVDVVGLVPREQLLPEMAKYRNVYAIGRTAIEAKILGCKVLPFHPRLMDTSIWRVIDNLHAAKILQAELDKIDRKEEEDVTEEV